MANSLHWRAFCLLLCLVSAPLLAATPPAPQRIITLTPHLTELLYDIGAGDRIVATDDASDFPAEVAALPRVANYRSINLEALLARVTGSRLGGPRYYQGRLVRLPVLGEGREPDASLPRRLLRCLQLAGWGWLALALLLTLLVLHHG